MDDNQFDSLEQSVLSSDFDYPLTNGDLDFSLPPDLDQLPILQSIMNASCSAEQVDMYLFRQAAP